MAEEKVLWKWESDTDLTKKKCSECKGPMYTDRASAVSYRGNTYHSHCLLTFLAKYHDTHCGSGGMGFHP